MNSSFFKYIFFVLIIHYDSTYANILGGGVITCACVAGKIGSSVNIVNSRTSASLCVWRDINMIVARRLQTIHIQFNCNIQWRYVPYERFNWTSWFKARFIHTLPTLTCPCFYNITCDESCCLWISEEIFSLF
jgi:hypothetical protein